MDESDLIALGVWAPGKTNATTDQLMPGYAVQADGGRVYVDAAPLPPEVLAALPPEASGLKLTIISSLLRTWGTHNLSFDSLFSGWASWPALYVNGSASAGGNGSINSPFYRIWDAVNAANASGVPTRIIIAGGRTWTRSLGISNSGSVLPLVPIVYISNGGRTVLGAHDSLTWAVDATVTTGTVYKTTRSGACATVDLLARDKDGCYPRLTPRASAADVGKYGGVYTDGTSIWVGRTDGLAVSDANTRVYLTVDNGRLSGTKQVSVAFIGANEGDGFDFEGGQAGAFRVQYTGNDGGNRAHIWMRDCTMRYSGTTTSGAVGNAAFEGVNGCIVLERCDWSKGSTDGLNVHSLLGLTLPEIKTFLLTINCTGHDHGLSMPYQSNNVWTLHDKRVVGIDVCSVGSGAAGCSFHIIDETIAFLVGTSSTGSVGDIHHGGGNPCVELKAQDKSKMFLYRPRISASPGGYAMRAEGTAGIYIRAGENISGMRYTGPTASIGTW